MADKKRQERVTEEIKKYVSEILREDVHDPGLPEFVSVIRVDLTHDLSYARIYVSILGSDEVKKTAMETLKHCTGFIRTELGKRLRIHHVPGITFIEDDSADYSVYISQKLRELNIRPAEAEEEEQ